MRDCSQCLKEWDECSCWGWSIPSIVFARPQVLWLVSEVLGCETWPHVEYLADKVQHETTTAPFIAMSEVTAELEARISFCGVDGEDFVHEVRRWEPLATGEHITYQDLTRESKQVSNYISGYRRRNVCYPVWNKCGRLLKEEILIKPCECGHNRWRTVFKGKLYACRKCGKVRNSSCQVAEIA